MRCRASSSAPCRRSSRASTCPTSFVPGACGSALAKPTRLADEAEPLAAQSLLARHVDEWEAGVPGVRHYLYQVHRSGAYLGCSSLAATLHLLLMRWVDRDFEGAFRLAGGVGADTPLTSEEAQLWGAIGDFDDDAEPAAHAVRLRLHLATRTCPELRCSWSVADQLRLYLAKLPYVPPGCQLSAADELTLLDAVGAPANSGRRGSEFADASLRARRDFLRAAVCAADDARGGEVMRCEYPTPVLEACALPVFDSPFEYNVLASSLVAPAWQKRIGALGYSAPADGTGPAALKVLSGWLGSGIRRGSRPRPTRAHMLTDRVCHRAVHAD